MKKFRIAIIGTETEGISLYHSFKSDPCIEIAGFADLTGKFPDILVLRQNGITIYQTIEELISIDGLDIIFETTGIPGVSKKVHDMKNSYIQVVESSCLGLFNSIKDRSHSIEFTLLSLIESVDDGVQIVNKEGIITYINNSFLKISGLSYKELMGQSIFKVLPESPTAKALKQLESISGEKFLFNGSSKEVSFLVTPLVDEHVCSGVIAVYRELTDMKKLMKELIRSRSIIEDIYERVAQAENFPGLVDSDLITIDHMEQVLVRQALTKFGYSVEGKKMAAKALNISLATLYNKLKKYQIS